jgi:hypothetical protein
MTTTLAGEAQDSAAARAAQAEEIDGLGQGLDVGVGVTDRLELIVGEPLGVGEELGPD